MRTVLLLIPATSYKCVVLVLWHGNDQPTLFGNFEPCSFPNSPGGSVCIQTSDEVEHRCSMLVLVLLVVFRNLDQV